jgi:predicted aminopeptidase
MPRPIIALLAFAALSGCTTLGYYGQAVSGQLSVLARARPIVEVLDDPAVTPDVKARLRQVQAAREFAVTALGLPDNDTYTRYADLERRFALWNVFATPELSLVPKQWCPLLAGCMAYRSYFSQAAAERDAEQLRREGLDVYVGGVVAYSTTGWFDDPVYSTMLGYPEPELAGILFHELAHQQIFVPGDTTFNESFASMVEREGVRRWLAARGTPEDYAAYLERNQRREQFIALMQRYRARLEALYRSAANDDAKRAGKQSLFDELRQDYGALKQDWGGYSGYDRWMETLNNARFVSIGVYNDHIPALEALLVQHGGDLPAFYRAAAKLANLPHTERGAALLALTATK